MRDVSAQTFRYTSLDSLRGIAALGVVLTHVLQYGFPQLALNHTLFQILVNGRCFMAFFIGFLSHSEYDTMPSRKLEPKIQSL
ncbi:MAG: hypothetical protein WC521_07940 [Bdellovibrionales bacterium]|jgi:peptidoglycan/LPS O-acetylase OafA/YrhL